MAETYTPEVRALLEAMAEGNTQQRAAVRACLAENERLTARVEELEAEKDRETAWLIEAPGHNYLHAKTLGGETRFDWTPDHNGGLRFRSKQEAQGVLDAVRGVVPEVFSFAYSLGDAWPREHAWIKNALTHPAPTPGEEHTGTDQ